MKNVLKMSAALFVVFIANTTQAQINVGGALGGSVSSGVNTAKVGSVVNATTSDVVNRAATTTRNEVNKVKSVTDNVSEKANATIRENRRRNVDATVSGQTSANGQVHANSGANVEVRSNNSTSAHHEHSSSEVNAQHSSEANVSISDVQAREEARATSDRTKAKIRGTQEAATRKARKLTDQAKSIQPSATVNTQVSGGLKTGR